MRRAVLNVVGLSARDLSSGVMPRLAARAAKGSVARVKPAFPAVTCTAQSDYLTGQLPSAHGIVGNGWYDRALSVGAVLEAVEPPRRRAEGLGRLSMRRIRS